MLFSSPLPRGPKGERRPADVVGNGVHVMRIATGEVEGVKAPRDPAKEYMRRGGLAGGKTRAKKLPKAKLAIAKKAVRARWAKRAQLVWLAVRFIYASPAFHF